MVKRIDRDGLRLPAGLGQCHFVGLPHFDPQARGAGEVAQPGVGFVGVRQALAEGQRAVAAAHRLQRVRLQRERGQAHHHAFVGFAGMARERERVVGVVAVVDVGHGELRLEDGGLDCHGPATGRP